MERWFMLLVMITNAISFEVVTAIHNTFLLRIKTSVWKLQCIWWNCLWFLSWYIYIIRCIKNGYLCAYEYTPHDTITFFQLFHARHISNGDICRTDQTLWELICNSFQLKLFWCASKYMNMKSVLLIYLIIRELMG